MAVNKLAEGFSYAALAGEDLSSSLNRFMKVNSSGEIVACGDNEKPLGVLYEVATEGAPATVYWASICKVMAGAAIAAGARVACGASGKAKTSTGTNPVGIALNAASGDGVMVSVAMVG